MPTALYDFRCMNWAAAANGGLRLVCGHRIAALASYYSCAHNGHVSTCSRASDCASRRPLRSTRPRSVSGLPKFYYVARATRMHVLLRISSRHGPARDRGAVRVYCVHLVQIWPVQATLNILYCGASMRPALHN